jgi:hypothetical protein
MKRGISASPIDILGGFPEPVIDPVVFAEDFILRDIGQRIGQFNGPVEVLRWVFATAGLIFFGFLPGDVIGDGPPDFALSASGNPCSGSVRS